MIPSIDSDLSLIRDRYNILVSTEKNGQGSIIRDDNHLGSIINKMKNISGDYTYMYLDTSDENGTMNYYRLRYALVPAKSLKYQYYGYQPFDEELYTRLIQQFEVDYLIVHRDNGFLEYLGEPYRNQENAVFRITNKSTGELRSRVELVN